MADTSGTPSTPDLSTAAPASAPAAAASSGDSYDTAFSAFDAAWATLSSGTESAPAAAPSDGSTAGAATGSATEPAAAGTEQPDQSSQTGDQGATGAANAEGTAGGEGEGGEAKAGKGTQGDANAAAQKDQPKPGDAKASTGDDEFDTRLKELGLWDSYKRREQSATDKGAARERTRLQREQTVTQVTKDHESLVTYVREMPAEERTAWVQSLPEFQQGVDTAVADAASEAGTNVVRDFATTLGLDLGKVPAEAFAEALEGKPERLRDAILTHSRYVQQAISTAQEAGKRVGRDELRAANPLPQTGSASSAATKKPETYDEAMSSFDQAFAGVMSAG
jgi:hypothetical protein